MTIPTPTEFWTFNNTRVGAVAGTVLTSQDGLDHFVDPGKILQGWDFYNPVPVNDSRRLSCPLSFVAAGQPWSLALWLKRRNTTNQNCSTIELSGTSGPAVLLADEQNAFNRTARITVDGSSSRATKTFAKDTNYHLLVATHDGGTGFAIYVDGAKATGTGASPTRPVDTLYVGRAFYINGIGDSIGIWDDQLSDAEVAELYNAGAGWEYTPPTDNTPDAFAFANVSDADPSTSYTSDSQVITGMDAGTAVSITGGEYRINGGAWTAAAGTIDPGQTLELRATSSAESEGVVTVTITVGTVSVDWTLTTKLIASVVTTILWGSTPDTSRILSSRIVRGAL